MDLKSRKAAGSGSFLMLFGFGAWQGGLIQAAQRLLAALGDFTTLLDLFGTVLPFAMMAAGIVSLAWGFGLVDLKRPPRRIELYYFVQLAKDKFGWDFGGESLDPLDLALGLVQAAVDKDILFFGRNTRGSTLIHTYPLVPIPGTFFDSHDLNILWADDNTKTQTTDLRSEIKGTPVYVDLYVHRKQALRWLKRSAAQYRGITPNRKNA